MGYYKERYDKINEDIDSMNFCLWYIIYIRIQILARPLNPICMTSFCFWKCFFRGKTCGRSWNELHFGRSTIPTWWNLCKRSNHLQRLLRRWRTNVTQFPVLLKALVICMDKWTWVLTHLVEQERNYWWGWLATHRRYRVVVTWWSAQDHRQVL